LTLSQEQIEKIRKEALRLGFASCGFTPLREFSEEKELLQQWINNGYHGEMSFMEHYLDKRTNPTLLQEGFRSAIVVLMNYSPKQLPDKGKIPKVSKYALGQDYHHVMKDRLCRLRDFINDEIRPIEGRCFVDSAPIYETQLAVDAGLGWKGKNTLLINKYFGSYVFIGELLSNIELKIDSTIATDHCGNCTLCVDACPTGALKPHFLNAQKCISYLTIERKSMKQPEYNTSPWIYGCDICQDVCPWNRKIAPTAVDAFLPKPFLLSANIQEWENLSEPAFKSIFNDSPLLRTGFERIKRNLKAVRDRL